MRTAIAILFLFVCLASTNNVVDLTERSFEGFLKKHDFFIVKFYTTWCGYSVRLAPKYEKAAEILSKQGIILAQMDCDDNKSICDKYGAVEGAFPVLRFFKNGVAEPYAGELETQSLVKVIRGNSGPPCHELSTVEEVESFLASVEDDVSIVGFFKTKAESEVYLNFTQLYYTEYHFGVVYNEEVINSKSEGKSSVIVYRHFEKEEPSLSYTDDLMNSDKLKYFIHSSSIPRVGVFTADYLWRYSGIGLPRLSWIGKFDEEHDPSGYNYIINRMKKVEKEYRGKLIFTLQRSDEVEVFLIKAVNGKFCVFEEGEKRFCSTETKFSLDFAFQFAKDYTEGKIEEYFYSDPIPTDVPSDSHVIKVVGRTFRKEVMEAKEDVFVKFHSPYCDHCVRLIPKFEELAKQMAIYSSIKFVELDATGNEFPPIFIVNGFPTIYLLPADNKKKPVLYEGPRETDAMKRWLEDRVFLIKTEL